MEAAAADPATQYRRWLDGLTAGRSFITNGPALWLEVEGTRPGHTLLAGRSDLLVEVRWRASQPVHRVELVRNGRVVERAAWGEGQREGAVRWRTAAGSAGEWVAARCFGRGRTSYGHFLWAHTSPIHLSAPDAGVPTTPEAKESAAFFVSQIGRSLEWIGTTGRYREVAHRERMSDLFRSAQDRFRALL